jgi:hypothetical protein
MIDADTAAAERTMLALRTDLGLPAADAAIPPLAGVVAWGVEQSLLDITADSRIVLTTRGRLLSNEVFARLV